MNKAFDFIQKCEKLIRNKRLNALRGTLMNHGQFFLDEFHRRQMEELKVLMHSEQWSPEAVIPKSFQDIVNNYLTPDQLQKAQVKAVQVLESIIAPQATPASAVSAPSPAVAAQQFPDVATPPAEGTPTVQTQQAANCLNVNGELFPVSGSVLMLVKMITDYIEFFNSTKYPFINPLDLSGRLFRFISVSCCCCCC